MAKRDTFLLRVDPRILDSIRAWSADEMRSVNSQIEFLLRESLRIAGRLPNASAEATFDAGDRPHRHDEDSESTQTD